MAKISESKINKLDGTADFLGELSGSALFRKFAAFLKHRYKRILSVMRISNKK